jgi:WD40 repeat protein
MVDINKRYFMIKAICMLILFWVFNSVTVHSQEISPIVWEPISQDNAERLVSAFGFQLETPVQLGNSGVYIDDLYIIPNTPYLFVSYKDRDTRQRFSAVWQIWDIETMQLIFSEISSAESITFASNGEYFIMLSKPQNEDVELCLWQIADFTRMNCWDSMGLNAHPFNTTNQLLGLSKPNGLKNEFIGWDIVKNQEKFILEDVHRWAFSPIEPYHVVIANSNEVSLWDVEKSPQQLVSHKLNNEVMISDLTFDSSGNNVFFITFSLVDSTERLNRLDLTSSEVTIRQGRIFETGLFHRLYVNIFPFMHENRFMADLIDGLTFETIRNIAGVSILDSNLNQDLLLIIPNDDGILGDSFSVQNLTNEAIYATFPYTINGIRYLDIQFTQDERFILAYTEGGLVQLWGIPADDRLKPYWDREFISYDQ